MIFSPVHLQETLHSEKLHFVYFLCNLYMWILIWVVKKKPHSCTDFTHQTVSSLQLIHISWQQMRLLTKLYILARSFGSAVKLEWKPPVSLTFPLLNDALRTRFSTWLPCAVKDYLVCLWNYQSVKRLHIINFFPASKQLSFLLIKFPLVSFPSGTGTDLLHMCSNSCVLGN